MQIGNYSVERLKTQSILDLIASMSFSPTITNVGVLSRKIYRNIFEVLYLVVSIKTIYRKINK